ncbi:MAG: Calx-beta domain-containing protein [Gammaproteobacteria bacterium]
MHIQRPALLASIIFAVAISLSTQLAQAAAVKDYSVQASATVQKSPAQITLTWPQDFNATGYTVYRKAFNATTWNSVAALPGSATGYTDTTVSVGSAYEYRISKAAGGYSGQGYVYAGIEAPMIESRGKLILMVDSTYAADLAAELARLQHDLVGDGWQVLRHDVPRSSGARAVKNIIKADYAADPANVKAVFLFGHVAVPYSGNKAWDGHPEHMGAWPADVFYGEMTDTGWTDTSVYNTSATSRPENRNVPGDGKFDQSFIPSDVELQVGRVDLFNMPAFLPKTEKDLLRQYLNKDHNFRHNLAPFNSVARRGLIDDNFGVFNGSAFAANGWRNFAPFFGAGNVQGNTDNTAIDWFPTLSANSYLWGYGTGPGHFQGSLGVGTTGPSSDPKFGPYNNFVVKDTKVVFTMLFGSAFGDWDVVNNFLRAPLATTTYGLTSSWSGWPHWFYHHMALGETIGYSTRLSQNNSNLYTNQVNSSTRGIHMALLGDPTLRMHAVSPSANLQGTATATGVNLNWTASTSGALQGYHVYRGTSANGPFTRLTGAPITGTSFVDSGLAAGRYTYMVRAVKLETSASGSYLNPSQGVFMTLDAGGTVSSGNTLQFSMSGYQVSEGSNPALATITVTRAGTSGAVSVNYATRNGTAVAGSDYTSSSGTLIWATGDATAKTFTVPIINDTLVEANETVSLSLNNPGGAVLGTVSSSTLTIVNDDVAVVSGGSTLQFSGPSFGVNESKGLGYITVTRSGTSGAVSVKYSTSNGTALTGYDYGAKSGTIYFADGDNTPKQFTIPVINDWKKEPSETVNVSLSMPSGNAVLGTQRTAAMTIYDND